MKQRATKKQMEMRRQQAEYKKQYDFWNTLPYEFRLSSFIQLKKEEQNNEIKSLLYKVLENLTQ